jgi:hypothetical protein
MLLTVLYSGSVAASPCADQTQRGLDVSAGATRDKADAALNGAYTQIDARLADDPGKTKRLIEAEKAFGTPNAASQIQIRRAARSIPWKSLSGRRSSDARRRRSAKASRSCRAAPTTRMASRRAAAPYDIVHRRQVSSGSMSLAKSCGLSVGA